MKETLKQTQKRLRKELGKDWEKRLDEAVSKIKQKKAREPKIPKYYRDFSKESDPIA